MAGQAAEAVRRPRTDYLPLYDVINGPAANAALTVAHRRGLFRVLEGTRLTAGELGEALELKPRSLDAMLPVLVTLGLLDAEDGRYGLSGLSEDYLLESSPTHVGFLVDVLAEGDWSFAVWDAAVASGEPQRPDMNFATFEEQADAARGFTRAMHSLSFAPALVWPELIDLAGVGVVLDVGGGSGAHSICACLQWPALRALVLDLPPVCDVAEEFVAKHGLADRISTHGGDMWVDPFPAADVHFYSNILHDWPPAKGRFLLEKSLAALESGGRILIHEVLFDDDKSGPASAALYSMWMLVASEGQQYSGGELTELLTGAGFADVRITPVAAPHSVVEARKP
jgi:predicted O-methyltransferase YrrM